MTGTPKNIAMFAVMAALLAAVGMIQSWSLALAILNLCLISAIMALGINMQYGYAGLFNVGIMGFAALGGVTAVIISYPPVWEGIAAGGSGLALSFLMLIATIVICVITYRRMKPGSRRVMALMAIGMVGYFAIRYFYSPAVTAIEAYQPASFGFLGGFGLPIIIAWPIAGLAAAGLAWIIGKISLGLRSDYLAIATLGISEIIVSILKNEDWLARGVKNVIGLPRPVPYEIELQKTPWFQEWAASLGVSVIDASSVFVKLCYAGLFAAVLLILLWLSERALSSPWGRMMRAIRDNEVSANAMGKNVTRRHLQVFILGSAVVGIAGAMLTTLDGQFTPGTYNPLRFTFLIWVMVIVGGSGNNWGSVLGGFLIWYFWIQAEPIGIWLMNTITAGMAADNPVKLHLIDGAAHMRLIVVGLILLLVMRFNPGGLIPERKR